MNVYSFLKDSVKRYPENIAIVYRGRKVKYSMLLELVDRLAYRLKKYGIKKGDRIIFLLDNSINYVVAYFAVLKVGGVIVALNTDTTSREVRHILDSCKPAGVFINKVYEKYIEEYKEIRFKIVDNGDTYEHGLNDILQAEEMDDEEVKVDEHNDLAQIIYTSGTTGKPKGVMLTHLNIRSNTESIVEYLKLTSEDKIMVVLPFFYSYGNSLLLTHIKVGGTLVISEQFVFLNKVLELMIKEKVTGFAGVPSSYALLLYKSNIRNLKFPDLRYFTCAGGALPPSNIVELKSIFPDVEYYAMYGQTEATARLSYLEPDKWREKLGSAGKAIPGVSLKIKDKNGREVKPGEVGEIVAQGLNIMKGYWGEPEETKKVLKEDGLHTGDMAKIDEEGYIFIVGRQSDMIKSGAFRIHPKEIEEIIMEIPGIAECAVVGVPDEIMGEVIKAFVVLDKNVSIEERDILRCCKMNLPEYKMPKSVKFIEELPKTRSGKIKRYVLKSMND